MLLPQLQPPLRAALSSIARSSSSSTGAQAPCITEAFAQLAIGSWSTLGQRAGHPSLVFKRHASHAQQATVSKGKDGPGKRLGAKRSGEQYVIPGNIIFRQRGTHWFPGENCGLGRDHTIYALQPGYVKYYKDPERHPDRKYIGVTLKKEDVLPHPRNAMRRRRLGMVTSVMEEEPEITPSLSEVVKNAVEEVVVVKRNKREQRIFDRGDEGRVLTLRPGYMYRESNWEIGRAAERAQVKVKEFKPRDRWAAWRKRAARKEKALEMNTLKRNIRKA